MKQVKPTIKIDKHDLEIFLNQILKGVLIKHLNKFDPEFVQVSFDNGGIHFDNFPVQGSAVTVITKGEFKGSEYDLRAIAILLAKYASSEVALNLVAKGLELNRRDRHTLKSAVKEIESYEQPQRPKPLLVLAGSIASYLGIKAPSRVRNYNLVRSVAEARSIRAAAEHYTDAVQMGTDPITKQFLQEALAARIIHDINRFIANDGFGVGSDGLRNHIKNNLGIPQGQDLGESLKTLLGETFSQLIMSQINSFVPNASITPAER